MPCCREGAQSGRSQPVVLIYRDQLLPHSETFILAQGESCSTHRCLYVGLTSVGDYGGLGECWQGVIAKRSIVLAPLMWPSQLWKLGYRLWGIVPLAWRRSLQVYSPRLLHAHFGPDGGFAARLAQALAVPLVVTFHGYDATWQAQSDRLNVLDLCWRRSHFFKTLALQQRRVPFRAASRIIAVSHFIRRELIALGCPPEKITVHYTGIDLQLFRPDPDIARQRIVLFVGRLVEKKGCAVLIEAMAQVQTQLAQKGEPAVRLVMVGKGGLRSHLENKARVAQANGLTDYSFVGACVPAQVRAWMNQSWLLCAPSLVADSGDTEGLGMVLLEAQAMGLPVVATCSGGIPEAVIDQQTGLLVPEKCADALAQAILRILGDVGLRDRLAAAGRQHVETQFDLHKNTARLEELYSAVIQEHSAKKP